MSEEEASCEEPDKYEANQYAYNLCWAKAKVNEGSKVLSVCVNASENPC